MLGICVVALLVSPGVIFISLEMTLVNPKQSDLCGVSLNVTFLMAFYSKSLAVAWEVKCTILTYLLTWKCL